MAAGDVYRTLAAKCDVRALNENDLAIRHEWEIMARSYRRLAEQAERNGLTDVVYEPPPTKLHDREPPAQTQQPQSQQQPQAKLEPDE